MRSRSPPRPPRSDCSGSPTLPTASSETGRPAGSACSIGTRTSRRCMPPCPSMRSRLWPKIREWTRSFSTARSTSSTPSVTPTCTSTRSSRRTPARVSASRSWTPAWTGRTPNWRRSAPRRSLSSTPTTRRGLPPTQWMTMATAPRSPASPGPSASTHPRSGRRPPRPSCR